MTTFQIKSRFTGAVIFEAEIAAECDGNSYGFRLGLAVKAAHLRGAHLSYADLSGADLSGADLSYADLSGAALSYAALRGAALRGAALSGAYLRDAHLSGADLRGAALSGADLSYADLSGADLSGADLSGAHLRGAALRGAALRDAKIIRVIARVTRVIDPYEFIAFETDKGVIIRAGCRTMSPAEYRAHVDSEYPTKPKAKETLAILDYIEARTKKLGAAQ